MNEIVSKSKSCIFTMKLLGDYWTLRALDSLRHGEVRFCELQRRLDNVNPVTLTTKLKKLEAANLVVRSEETLDKLSVTYRLSELGQKTLPIIKAIDKFEADIKSQS